MFSLLTETGGAHVFIYIVAEIAQSHLKMQPDYTGTSIMMSTYQQYRMLV